MQKRNILKVNKFVNFTCLDKPLPEIFTRNELIFLIFWKQLSKYIELVVCTKNVFYNTIDQKLI